MLIKLLFNLVFSLLFLFSFSEKTLLEKILQERKAVKNNFKNSYFLTENIKVLGSSQEDNYVLFQKEIQLFNKKEKQFILYSKSKETLFFYSVENIVSYKKRAANFIKEENIIFNKTLKVIPVTYEPSAFFEELLLKLSFEIAKEIKSVNAFYYVQAYLSIGDVRFLAGRFHFNHLLIDKPKIGKVYLSTNKVIFVVIKYRYYGDNNKIILRNKLLVVNTEKILANNLKTSLKNDYKILNDLENKLFQEEIHFSYYKKRLKKEIIYFHNGKKKIKESYENGNSNGN